MMEHETELFERLCMDEAVCFIADRHNVTSRQLLQDFFSREVSGKVDGPATAAVPLEPNETEILKGLSEAIND